MPERLFQFQTFLNSLSKDWIERTLIGPSDFVATDRKESGSVG